MVNIVNYGALDARPAVDKRQSAVIYGGVAILTLLAVATIIHVNNSGKTSELFEYKHIGAHSADFAGTVEPATLNDDQVD